jgi:GTP pyrophosphokinase
VAVRIIVKDISECYKTLGIVHKYFKPLPRRFKDYISTPKPNGYQSLHTSVFSPEGKIVEVQIRTFQMHKAAEYGIAAHWSYSENKGFKNYLKKLISKAPESELAWVQQLSHYQTQKNLDDQYFSKIKINFFTDRIFAFTPKGEIKELPLGATPIDFAYAIHTELGHNCQQVEINGKLSSLNHPLISGDIVNIITSKNKKGPTRDWLDFVETDQAKNSIRKWFANANKESSLALGKKALDQELREIKGTSLSKIPKNKIRKALQELNFKTFDDVIIAIGQGNLLPIKVVKHLFETYEILPQKRITIQKQKKSTVKIDGKENILAKFCHECKPQPGDKIKAYITSKGIATIHAVNCERISKSQNKQRIIRALWVKNAKELFYTTLEILTKNEPGTLREIVAIIHKMQINIENISTSYKKRPSNLTTINLEISIEGLDQLKKLIQLLKNIPNVIRVTKTSR